MNINDHIGKRGEYIFAVLITRPCDGGYLFNPTFLGDKHETADFEVELVNPSSGHAPFYVQVKSTTARYTGSGEQRRIAVRVGKRDVEKLKNLQAPTYVVGVDIDNERGYLKAITPQSNSAISGIPVRNSLDCVNLKALWKYVDDYWKAKSILIKDSPFS